MSDDYAEIAKRLKAARARRKMSQSALARALEVSRGAVGQWEIGRTAPSGGNLRQAAKILGVNAEWLETGRGEEMAGRSARRTHSEDGTDEPNPVKTLGEVAAGAWKDVQQADEARYEDEDIVRPPPDPRFPAAAQYDLSVRGTSINRFARDGDRLRCLDLWNAGIEIADGSMVVVKRTRDEGGLLETTAKRVRRRGATLELWPDSDDPRWQEPIVMGSDPERETVEIAALVLYAYRPSPRR